jgi:hypothetical protein
MLVPAVSLYPRFTVTIYLNVSLGSSVGSSVDLVTEFERLLVQMLDREVTILFTPNHNRQVVRWSQYVLTVGLCFGVSGRKAIIKTGSLVITPLMS